MNRGVYKRERRLSDWLKLKLAWQRPEETMKREKKP